jgi:hypothetical protein
MLSVLNMQDRFKSFRVRFYSTIVLIASFMAIIYAGHVPLMFMIFAIQVRRWRLRSHISVTICIYRRLEARMITNLILSEALCRRTAHIGRRGLAAAAC